MLLKDVFCNGLTQLQRGEETSLYNGDVSSIFDSPRVCVFSKLAKDSYFYF